jgi:hypothetical protein
MDSIFLPRLAPCLGKETHEPILSSIRAFAASQMRCRLYYTYNLAWMGNALFSCTIASSDLPRANIS